MVFLVCLVVVAVFGLAVQESLYPYAEKAESVLLVRLFIVRIATQSHA